MSRDLSSGSDMVSRRGLVFYVLLAISITQVATTLRSRLTSAQATYLPSVISQSDDHATLYPANYANFNYLNWLDAAALTPDQETAQPFPSGYTAGSHPNKKRQSVPRPGIHFLKTSHSANPQRQKNAPTQGQTEGLRLLLFAQK